MKSKCEHPEFTSSLEVTRKEFGRLVATVKIRCNVCGKSLQFFGMAPGLNINGVSCSEDRTELYVAVGTPNSIIKSQYVAAGLKPPRRLQCAGL